MAIECFFFDRTCHAVRSRELVARMAAANLSRGGVQRQLRTGNADLASANITRESEIAELRNQSAIIRC